MRSKIIDIHPMDARYMYYNKLVGMVGEFTLTRFMREGYCGGTFVIENYNNSLSEYVAKQFSCLAVQILDLDNNRIITRENTPILESTPESYLYSIIEGYASASNTYQTIDRNATYWFSTSGSANYSTWSGTING